MNASTSVQFLGTMHILDIIKRHENAVADLKIVKYYEDIIFLFMHFFLMVSKLISEQEGLNCVGNAEPPEFE